jgi:hypothetical protein
MFKLLWKLIVLSIIAVIVFIALSFYSGGEKFRWFGKKVQQESEKVGEKADVIKEKSEGVKKGIEKAKEKVKDFTGKKDEKSR